MNKPDDWQDTPGYDPLREAFTVPEEPFGLSRICWMTVIVLFTLLLVAITIFILSSGGSPALISVFYVIPAILLAYFFRRRGVLAVYLLSMSLLVVIMLFRSHSGDEIFAAVLMALLLMAIALFVSHLTHHVLLEKRKYHAIFDNTESGVVLLSLPDNAILEMNQRFALSLRLLNGNTTGRTLDEFIPDSKPVLVLLEALKTRCSVPATETIMRRADGTQWVAVIVARKISADHAVFTFVDITERKKMDDDLRHLHEDANLYLDILTHDINNLNMAGLGYGRILELQPGIPRPDIPRKIVGTLEKSDEIIRNVSTLRKMKDNSAKLGPVRIRDIIQKEVAVFSDAADIVVDVPDVMVSADEMLSSVFGNLIGNSIKYGGPQPRVVIRVVTSDPGVLVSIEDHGSGIPDRVKPHVFDRFQRGDTTVSGKGLGLFICRMLVERYGGRIWAEDRVPGDPSRGAVIRFTLKTA